MLTGRQIRAGRALADMSQEDLAKAAGISAPTVKRLERIGGPISANTATEDAIRKAFAAAGVIVIDENGEGAGVRMRKG